MIASFDVVLRPRLASRVPQLQSRRENGINANMLFTWRRRYREQLQAETTSLIPVAVVHETPAQRVTMSSDARAVGDRTTRAGTIEIRFGEVVVKVDGIVDADTLRVVLGSMRS